MKTVTFTKYAAWKLGLEEGDVLSLSGVPHSVKVKDSSSPFGYFRPNYAEENNGTAELEIKA